MLRVELCAARGCRPSPLSARVQNAGRCHRGRRRLRGARRHGESHPRRGCGLELAHHSGRPSFDTDRIPGRDRASLGPHLMSAGLRERDAGGAGPPSSASANADSIRAADLIARIESVPFSRWHIRPRVIMGSATFFDAFTALALASATPILVRLWGMTPQQIGYLLAASYIGQFVAALIFGWLGERIGRVMSATYGTLIMALVSLACAFTGNFSQMFICRLIQGIGVGGEMPVAATYVNELSRAHGRGRFFMLYELIFPIGLFAANVLGALLVPVYGWQVLFVLGTLPGLIITFLVV